MPGIIACVASSALIKLLHFRFMHAQPTTPCGTEKHKKWICFAQVRDAFDFWPLRCDTGGFHGLPVGRIPARSNDRGFDIKSCPPNFRYFSSSSFLHFCSSPLFRVSPVNRVYLHSSFPIVPTASIRSILLLCSHCCQLVKLLKSLLLCLLPRQPLIPYILDPATLC